MMRATVDLIGLYHYDDTVLDNLVVPADVDTDTVKDNLLLETAELELIYSDSSFMKTAIGVWSKKQAPVWDELLKTTKYEYNPIWNKDGVVKETETRNLQNTEKGTDNNKHEGTLKHAAENKSTTTNNLSSEYSQNSKDQETKALKNKSEVVTTEDVYGFNSNTDAPAKKTTQKGDSDDTGTDTNTHTGTSKETQTGNVTDAGQERYTDTTDSLDNRIIDKAGTDTGTIEHERIEQGNIGVTSTQSLILEQREVVKFNIMDIIIKDFIDRFCLKVY